jgi:gamma-glutamyltranspeptidase/glutathione hydrolase
MLTRREARSRSTNYDDHVAYRDASSRVRRNDMVTDPEARCAYRPVARGVNGAVSSGHMLATLAGYDVLRKGGNATDAGVASGVCLCVVEHDRTSFGGVAPIILYDAKSGKVTTIGGLGRWPAAVSLDYFQRNFGGRMKAGIATSITPAAMDAWLLALERYGTMSFAEIAQAALAYAEGGFPVSEVLREDIIEYAEGFKEWPSTAAIYTPRGKIPEVGELLKQPALAASIRRFMDVERKAGKRSRKAGLRALAQHFYEGPVARTMVEFCQRHGGLLTLEDLRRFRVKEEPPVKLRFGDLTVYTCGPWTQGPVLLQVLALLRAYDVGAFGHNSVDYIHTIVEAIKLAYADRDAYYGDPDFVRVPLRELLSEEYCRQRRTLIRRDRAWPDMPAPGKVTAAQPYFGRRPPHEDARQAEELAASPDTTVLAAIDGAGNIFCSAPSDPVLRHMIVPELGFGISPRGTQSWLHPSHPSVVAPGKRPRLTTNPVLALRKGKPCLALGTPGGDVQPQAMLQVLLNIESFGMNAQRATEEPRFASFSFPNSFYPHRSRPGEVSVETRIAPETIAGLEARGHKVKRWPLWSGNAGGACVIFRDARTGLLQAGADPRRDASAIAW